MTNICFADLSILDECNVPQHREVMDQSYILLTNSQMELDLPADVADLTNGSEAFVAMGSSPVRSKVRAWYGIDYESYERLDITK